MFRKLKEAAYKLTRNQCCANCAYRSRVPGSLACTHHDSDDIIMYGIYEHSCRHWRLWEGK